MWGSLKIFNRPFAPELDDIELVLNSMVAELQDWEHENKFKWILKRCKDIEGLISRYLKIYPQLSVFFNPINYHRLENE